ASLELASDVAVPLAVPAAPAPVREQDEAAWVPRDRQRASELTALDGDAHVARGWRDADALRAHAGLRRGALGARSLEERDHLVVGRRAKVLGPEPDRIERVLPV